MKHLEFTLKTGLLTLAFLIFGAVSGTVALSAQQQTSQVKYNTVNHDFGKIKETDGPVSYTFEFTNTSDTPFLIENIAVSCGCTSPEYNKKPVLPGKTGSIKIVYDPSGRPGVFNTQAVVISNNRKNRVSLTLRGEVIPRPKTIEDNYPVELSASGLRTTSNNVIFGYIGLGNQKSSSFNIINNGTVTMDIGYRFTSETDIPAGVCSLEIEPSRLHPQQVAKVTVRYDLSKVKAYGVLPASFLLTINGKETSKPISAYATVTDDFSKMTEKERNNAPAAFFSSQFYHFGSVKRNETLTREFILTNKGKSPLMIRKVTANSAGITYSIPKDTIAPEESVIIKVSIKTGNKKERISESISIVMNDPARPMREIRIGANVE